MTTESETTEKNEYPKASSKLMQVQEASKKNGEWKWNQSNY